MLTIGSNAIREAGKLPFKNTVYRKVKDNGIKRECHVEMYDDSGELLLSQSAEVGLMGDYSLDMPQKSFKFRSKSLYGSKTFNAKLFPDRDYTEYKGFVLRNSGNDCQQHLIDLCADDMMELCGQTIAHQAWKPYAVYLNGIYWGHMNLRERTDVYMIAQFEGMPLTDAKKITLLQGSGSAKNGSNKEFKAMRTKIKEGNPAKNAEDLQYILDNVDVDNLFEYMAFEMFFGNSDIGNTRYYKTNEPGSKWKWVLYDVDYGLFNSKFNSPWSYTKEKGMGQQNINNTIFLKLLSVPEYGPVPDHLRKDFPETDDRLHDPDAERYGENHKAGDGTALGPLGRRKRQDGYCRGADYGGRRLPLLGKARRTAAECMPLAPEPPVGIYPGHIQPDQRGNGKILRQEAGSPAGCCTVRSGPTRKTRGK